MNQPESKPFTVLSRARACRIAFLVDSDNCPPALIDALFKANYGLWGGRFNPIIPLSNGAIPNPFWLLLKYADPDIVYTYVKLSLDTIRRIEREVIPFRIQAHPEWMLQKQEPSFAPDLLNALVPSHHLIPTLLSMRSWSSQKPKVLTFKAAWNWPFRGPVMRNFGLFEESVFARLPVGTDELEIRNDWTYSDLFDRIARAGPIIFPFQMAEALSGFNEPNTSGEPGYSIIIGDDAASWLHFWNRIFLLPNPMGSRWTSLCLQKDLLVDPNFVGPLREFLKHFIHRNRQSPAELRFRSFELAEGELHELGSRVVNGIDAFARFEILKRDEFPSLTTSKPVVFPMGTPGLTGQPRFGSTQQQAFTRNSLLQPPESAIPLDQGTWIMDLEVEHVPAFRFYANEMLWWQLPRRLPAAEAFVPQTTSRINRGYSISIEMNHYGPFALRVPSDKEMLDLVLGIQMGKRYTAELEIEHSNPKFEWATASDKALYTNGIIELFGGLQRAGSAFHHRFWRTVFEKLSKRGGESEAKLFDSVRNSLNNKRHVILDQLMGGHEKPIDWLTRLVVKLARQQHAREVEISFQELKETFLKQREEFITSNPNFRSASSIEEIQKDQEQATQELMGVLQSLVDDTILIQGVTVRCHKCGSRFWQELASLEPRWQCQGCHAAVFAPVEPVWRYRLNALLRNGIAFHGCVAVISALYELRKNVEMPLYIPPEWSFTATMMANQKLRLI